MKRIQMLACATMVICGQPGCDLRPFEPAEADDAGDILGLPEPSVPDAQGPPIVLREAGKDAKAVSSGKRDWPVGEDVQEPGDPQDAEGSGSSLDELPNAILLATCESEPDEVAVPLNALDHRFCDTVQAVAYRADETGAYAVSAEYDWSIVGGDVATLVPLPGHEHGGVQRPSVKYDILWAQDQSQEPQASVKVCAQPKGGWPWPEAGPLCRTLLLRAVVNLDAAWCFAGDTFDSEDICWTIMQDGRYLQVGQDGQGHIDGKAVMFYKGVYLYQADLTTRDAMSGTVMDGQTMQVLGDWQAWRLNP